MTLLLFLFGVAVAAGLFFILADILKLPRLSTEKALLSAGRAEKKRMRSLDAIFLGWAIKISHFIRMDEYKRHRMERTLSAAGMDMTPEVYLAYTILKPAAALLAVIPCLLIFPLLSPIVVLLSILLYFKESRKAEEKVTERREKIEGELPRFVATVEQELGASRDVLTILENYKRHAGPDFARELDVLTADMRSSSYEAALVRFEGRLASPMLSDIVRGLIGVLRGDDGRVYFHISGDYRIVVEPLAYLCYNGQQFAMTATEAALYDQVVNGDLRKKLGTLTHKNLPLAIFLEEADLGYAAWSGSRTEKASNGDIISSLGIGIVRFNEVTTPPQPGEYDYEYRTNTEVITSVEVRGGQSDPDNPVSVRFNIQGRTYTVSNVYYPDGDSQLAWVRWRTPAEPCVITISVSVYGGGSAQGTITCNIVDLDGNDPPNPLADDRNNAFRLSSIPEKEQVTSASWGIWSPWWHENWEWVENWQKCWHTDRWTDADGKTHRDRWYHWVDNGWWEDHGWWEFDYNGYSASLTASMRITPDEKSPTATASTLKSGYGVQEKVTAKVTTNQSAAVTAAQNAVTYFPEFGYANYWRLLEAEISGRSTTFQFKANPYSTYNRRTHFTPIWYPDGSYTPYTWLLDCWTPAGMLSMNLTDSVTIRGNLWEEWHIAPAKQR